MKMNYTFLVIVLIYSVISCRVIADTEEGVVGTKNQAVSANVSDDRVNEIVDPMKQGESTNFGKNDLREQFDQKEGENEQKKVNSGDQKNEVKENEGSNSESKKESKEERLLPVREKCDSSSNRCTDDDKTFVACLTVPGDESPALSLLIQNVGKGSRSIIISVPDLVQLEQKKIELPENKDTEVKVSITGVESGHFIILTAGHGNCTLKFRDQFVGRKKVDHSSDSSYFNTFNLTLFTGVLFLAALLVAVVVLVFMCTKFGRKFFARKGPKYEKLETKLPVSHGSKLEPDGNEGWDDSWGDSWDDEEAPKTPSFPVTPSLTSNSKGLASRKFKEAWKD